jgi:hypothetical protein
MADNDSKKKKEGTTVPEELAQATYATGETPPPEKRLITNKPEEPVNVKITGGPVDVMLNGTPTGSTPVQGFWEYLRQRTDAISFNEYSKFIERVLCEGRGTAVERESVGLEAFRALKRISGVDAYQLLHAATEAFLLINVGSLGGATPTPIGDPDPGTSRFGGRTFNQSELAAKLKEYVRLTDGLLPYIHTITAGLRPKQTTPQAPPPTGTDFPAAEDPQGISLFCDDLDAKVLEPIFMELLWSYWHEEAMVVQSINALSLRFQNKRGPGERDPLANLETHPLRPLSNLLWGYIQDDDHRLTVARRAFEYEHEYGFSLLGRAVPKLRVADRRSKFIESFHTLLHQTAVFYDRSANLTFRADAFPLLNALREVHLVLAEGAHNQFREMPWTSRVEMLIQQWLLSRKEVRDFLGGRPAVPYTELWMSSVDALRRAMDWGDTATTHFNDLAVTGEKIVLSVRYGNWNDRKSEDDATGWAVFWKPEIQRYIHAYQAVTGVDLSATTTQTNRQIDATPPSVLLQQRIAQQRR